MVEESTAAAHLLSEETERLAHMIGRFKTGQEAIHEAESHAGKKTSPLASRPMLKTVSSTGNTAVLRKPSPSKTEWRDF